MVQELTPSAQNKPDHPYHLVESKHLILMSVRNELSKDYTVGRVNRSRKETKKRCQHVQLPFLLQPNRTAGDQAQKTVCRQHPETARVDNDNFERRHALAVLDPDPKDHAETRGDQLDQRSSDQARAAELETVLGDQNGHARRSRQSVAEYEPADQEEEQGLELGCFASRPGDADITVCKIAGTLGQWRESALIGKFEVDAVEEEDIDTDEDDTVGDNKSGTLSEHQDQSHNNRDDKTSAVSCC